MTDHQAGGDNKAAQGTDEDDLYESDSPYCECDLEPIEEELCGMTCFACGKEILP